MFYFSIANFLFSFLRGLTGGGTLGQGMGDLAYYLCWLVLLLVSTGLYIYDWNNPHWLLKTNVIILSASVVIFIYQKTYINPGFENGERQKRNKP